MGGLDQTLIFGKMTPMDPLGAESQVWSYISMGAPRPPTDPQRGHPDVPIEPRLMGPIFTSMGFGVQNDPPKGGSKGVIGPPKFFAIYLGSY